MGRDLIAPGNLEKYSEDTWLSTGETWIDGKPIYLKAYSGPIEVNSAIPGFSGVDTLISYGGCAKRTASTGYSGIPYAVFFGDTSSNYTISFRLEDGQIELRATYGGSTTGLSDARVWVKATLVD